MKKIVILSIPLVTLLVSGVLFGLHKALKSVTQVHVGPYTCKDRSLDMYIKVKHNSIAGVSAIEDLNVTFGDVNFLYFTEPFKLSKENGLEVKRYLSDSELESYIQDHTTDAATFDHKIPTTRHANISLISQHNVSKNIFSEFVSCFDSKADQIYTDGNKKDADTPWFVIDKVYVSK